MHASTLSRRRFLTLGLGAAGAWLFAPCRALAATAAAPAPSDRLDAGPAARDLRLRRGFEGIVGGARQWLTAAVGPQKADAVAAACPARLTALLPGVPDIGPANRNQDSLEDAVWLAALTLAMRDHGLPESMAGRLFYDLCAEEMRQRLADPQAARQLAERGAAVFTPAGRADLAAWTAATQKRAYPADWVGRAVQGDGRRFDIGYDYTECGAVKYFRAAGVARVAPYFCLNDFTTSRAMGTGLSRTRTIGQGDALCDFRYKQGGAVRQSWETETPRFRPGVG
jgi:hypothetical protein